MVQFICTAYLYTCSLDFVLTLVSVIFNYCSPFFLKYVFQILINPLEVLIEVKEDSGCN